MFMRVVLLAAISSAPAEAAFVDRWSAEPGHAGAHFGSALVEAGDVNGDNYIDVLVGAPHDEAGQIDEGRVYLYYGTASGPSSTPAWIGESNQAGALYGTAIAGLGDLDGDGYDDIAVGAPLYENGQTDEGAVFVYTGSDSGLAATATFVREGGQAGALFGAALGSFGDVDFDGYNDLLVGAPQYTNGQTREGRAMVYFGKDGDLDGSPGWTAEGNLAEAQFGRAVAFCDVDGDLESDVAVGAPYHKGTWPEEGRVVIYLGAPNGLPNNSSWSALGGRRGVRFGTAVTGLEDINADGYSDLAVGAPGWSVGAREDGAVFVYLGSENGALTIPTWKLTGGQEECGFGRSVADGSDLNDDGFTDLIAGAVGYSGAHERSGRAFVYYGIEAVPGQLSISAPALGAVLDGNQAGAGFGASVAGIDINVNFLGEVLIGSLHHANPDSAEGRASWFAYGSVTTGVGQQRTEWGSLSVAPNPARSGVWVSFTLPAAGPATLELLDIAGRRVAVREMNNLGAGRHRFDVTSGNSVAPGLYLARVAHGARQATAKVVVVR